MIKDNKIRLWKKTYEEFGEVEEVEREDEEEEEEGGEE